MLLMNTYMEKLAIENMFQKNKEKNFTYRYLMINFDCAFLLAGENLVGEGAGLFEEPPSEVAPPPQQQPHLQHQRPGNLAKEQLRISFATLTDLINYRRCLLLQAFKYEITADLLQTNKL